ncbi:DUF4255 domain-containing protein [Serratia rubidaea]|nr:DUF4255 domain-containing protein [Serratia rubidaea]
MTTNKGNQQQSDTTLIALNQNIQQSLQAYLPDEFNQSGRIRFDMFDKDKLPDGPTVCVFLYDIQEDLELRHGQVRQYDPQHGTFAHRQVYVRCCYLLTYWEPANNHAFAADSPSLQRLNEALNGLLNMQLPASAFVRVVAPSEHLSSLGNFWQSLGDRPRLSLNFTVTIPIELGLEKTDKDREKKPPVLSDALRMQTAAWEQDDLALTFKRALVGHVIEQCTTADDAPADWVLLRAQLARLQVSCDYGLALGAASGQPILSVTGYLDDGVADKVKKSITALSQDKEWAKKATVEVALKNVNIPATGEEGET